MLRTDSFMFLRKVPVDLQRYLPRFLYSDKIFSAAQGTLNAEHELYRLKLIEVAKQFFYQTATWGLDDWELLLKIPNVAEKDMELRRKLIGAKLLRNTTATVQNTKRLMREYATHGDVDIEELGGCRLRLIGVNSDFYWDEMLAALLEFLPAHLTFDFTIFEDFGAEYITFAQAAAVADSQVFNLDMLSPPPLEIAAGNFLVDVGTDTFGTADSAETFAQDLGVAIIELCSENLQIDCDRGELSDTETAEEFERYLRRRWAQFKLNPVIKFYTHEWQDLDSEIDEPEIFPIDQDFLRLYWQFPCGDDKWHIRYTTILNPRQDIEPAEVKYLSQVGTDSQMLLHSKKNIPTTGIIRAVYVKKQIFEVI